MASSMVWVGKYSTTRHDLSPRVTHKFLALITAIPSHSQSTSTCFTSFSILLLPIASIEAKMMSLAHSYTAQSITKSSWSNLKVLVKVANLLLSLYGIKQGSHLWNKYMNQKLIVTLGRVECFLEQSVDTAEGLTPTCLAIASPEWPESSKERMVFCWVRERDLTMMVVENKEVCEHF